METNYESVIANEPLKHLHPTHLTATKTLSETLRSITIGVFSEVNPTVPRGPWTAVNNLRSGSSSLRAPQRKGHFLPAATGEIESNYRNKYLLK